MSAILTSVSHLEKGSEELVLESATPKRLNDWSPDARFVVYDTGAFNGIAHAGSAPRGTFW